MNNSNMYIKKLITSLTACAEDPMWADHAEVPKFLLRKAAEELHNLSWALGTPGFEQMATPEQETSHQEAVQRIGSMLDRMSKHKSEYDKAMEDANRYRWLAQPGRNYLVNISWVGTKIDLDMEIDSKRKKDGLV